MRILDKFRKKNFSFLQNLINSGNVEIKLDSDILLTDDEISQFENKGITIKNSLIIDGDGHCINANGKTPIFRFFPNIDITLKNVTLKNGTDISGGAIRSLANLKVINCIFEGNCAENGGAIINESKMELVDSKFTGNSAKSVGGVILNFGDLLIQDCFFKNNSANDEGGVINNQKNANIRVLSSGFVNCSANNGGVISSFSEIFLSECSFINNISTDRGGAILCTDGNLKIEKCKFDGNSSKNGGTVFIFEDGYLDVESSDFNNNSAKYGGSLHSYGKLNISKSNFIENRSIEGSGGAIHNETGAKSLIKDCVFSKNECLNSLTGSIITNEGEIQIVDSIFSNNNSIQGGGIDNQPQGTLNVSCCVFTNNTAQLGGGIINFGNLSLIKSKFSNNYADYSGGSLDNSGNGVTVVSDCKFFYNSASFSGGSIRNNGKIKLFKCNFNENVSFIGGAIDNEGLLTIHDSEFNHNYSKNSDSASFIDKSANIIYNSNELKICNSKFIDGKDLTNLNNNKIRNSIINTGSLDINNSVFQDIVSQSVLSNVDKGNLKVVDCIFNNNSTKKSNIFNKGKSCGIINPIFEENTSLNNNYTDIINKSNLTLQKPNLIYFKLSKSILNEGVMDLRMISELEIEEYIHNSAKIIIDENKSERGNDKFNFSELDNQISMFSDEEIILKEDFIIDDSEIDFYEGGIILEKKGLTIDGKGHSIDAKVKSRIFIVTGENITLKNIVFKNGLLSNNLDKSSNGGGVIRIIKGGSLNLINCEFINNNSEGNGGVIFNRGTLNSNKSSYNNNNSDWMGGAVYNQGEFVSINDVFCENISKLGGAIYNYANLNIYDDKFLDNKSNINQQIFNNGVVNIQKDKNIDDLIYNNGKINDDNRCDVISFTDLNLKISNLDEIFLDEDVVFNFRCDQDFKKGILINKNLVIEGNGHAIDSKKSSVFFNIIKGEVKFKNIVFKNGFSDDLPLIQNKGFLTFENCKFDNNKMQDDVNLILNNNCININNCVFLNNFSTKNSIFFAFNDNKDNSIEIHNSDFFANCSSQNSIILLGNENVGNENVIIEESRFINNISLVNGSILHNFAANLCLKNSVFTDNYSNLYSVLHNDNYSNTKITGCDFNSNESKISIIYNTGKIEFNKSNFNYNNSRDYGVLNNTMGELKVVDCLFNENKSKVGAAIVNYSKSSIFNSIFTKNIAEFGGAINNQEGRFNQDVILIIDDCKFFENNAYHNGGVIDSVFGLLKIKDSIFESNYSEDIGGVISLIGPNEKECSIVNCKFFENHTGGYGGAIFNGECSNMMINSSLFETNFAEKSGGVMFSHGNLEVISSKFRNNCAKISAGAINSDKQGFIKVIRCNFRDNHVDENDGAFSGNAIKITDNGELIETNFYEKASVVYNKPIIISNCNFMVDTNENIKTDVNIGGNENYKLL